VGLLSTVEQVDWRILVGTLIVRAVRIGMAFLEVNVFVQQVVFAVVLIMMVTLTIARRKS